MGRRCRPVSGTPGWRSQIRACPVASCDNVNGKLVLAATSSADTGNPRTCTTAGCLFGAPVPAPNTASTPTSVCLINTIAQNVTGLATCVGQVTSLNVPVNTEIFL